MIKLGFHVLIVLSIIALGVALVVLYLPIWAARRLPA